MSICDFNSHAIKADTPEAAYIDTLLKDLAEDLQQHAITRPISTIFNTSALKSIASSGVMAATLK